MYMHDMYFIQFMSWAFTWYDMTWSEQEHKGDPTLDLGVKMKNWANQIYNYMYMDIYHAQIC